MPKALYFKKGKWHNPNHSHAQASCLRTGIGGWYGAPSLGAPSLEGWENTQEGKKLNTQEQRGKPGRISVSLAVELCLAVEESLKDFRE